MNSVFPTIAVLLSLIFQECYITQASRPVTYIVVDDLGWTLSTNPESWPRGKKFYAGDILGKLEEAIEHLTEAILQNPTSAIMYATKGCIRFLGHFCQFDQHYFAANVGSASEHARPIAFAFKNKLVTVECRNAGGAMVPIRVHTILISTQHDENVTNEQVAADLKGHVIEPVIPARYLGDKTIFHLNPFSWFVIGGPH